MRGCIFPFHSNAVVSARRQWAMATGEVRQPARGELFVSGAVPEVYVAAQDMVGEFHIAVAVPDPPTTIVVGHFRYRLEGCQ